VVARRGGADRQLAVCVGSRGPGICTLIKRLTLRGVAHHVWVLTIAVHIPLAGVGSSYSQETRPQALFCECGVYCELLGTAEMARGASSRLRCAAVEERGVAVGRVLD
jgi:pyruvate dehydrogenase (quinone)